MLWVSVTDVGVCAVYLNDLWRYSTSDNTWTWMGGTNATNSVGKYGTQVPSTANYPGGRYGATVLNINDSELWMYGGWGLGSATGAGTLQL